MALDEKHRQRKRAEKRTKRKARLLGKKAHPSFGGDYPPAVAARFPIRDCLVPDNLFEAGIGTVLLSRSLPGGDLAVAGFLVDTFCLGCKDAFYRVTSPEYFARHLERMGGPEAFDRVDPSCLRKLVEGAVDYARQLGFAPHPDFASAAKLFGSIEPASCSVSYTYGKDGKPLYVSGPYESRAQSREIIETLARRVGPDKFHFVTGGDISEDADPDEAPESGLLELSYEITDQPLPDPAYDALPDPVREQLESLYHGGMLRKPEKAAALLESLVERYPHVPQLYNWLNIAYQQAGEQGNAERVMRETYRRFPDYLFGRIAYASDCLRRGDIDKVPEIFDGEYELKLIYPDRERFHIAEVMGFYATMAWYFHARGEAGRAETYYEVLRELDPEHPNTRLVEQLLYP